MTPPLTPLTVVPVPGQGAEDVLVAEDGTVFTGTDDGSIFAVSPDGHLIRRVATTGGRPLGLEWLSESEMVVCDSRRGLLVLDLGTGALRLLTDSVGGRPFRFCNNAAVLDDGSIWFTDSSTQWGIEEWKSDLIENTCTGRLLRLGAGESEPEVVLDGLSFANGVARTADGSAVVVAETGHRRLQAVQAAGERAGQADLLVDDMPAHPDNIALGSDGLIWVTYASPTDPILTWLQTKAPAWLRGLVRRAPDAVKPSPKRTTRVAAYDSAGRLVHDVSAQADAWHMATGVREKDGRVWLGSLVQPAIAWFDL
jgi:sugar lactone lactonase YvrE